MLHVVNVIAVKDTMEDKSIGFDTEEIDELEKELFETPVAMLKDSSVPSDYDDDVSGGGDSVDLSFSSLSISDQKEGTTSTAISLELFKDLNDETKEIVADDALSDDEFSVMSGLSDHSTQGIAKEQKTNRFQASNLAKKWCRDNFLNNKSLGIALSLKNDIIRLLCKFNDGLLWKLLPDGTPTNQKNATSTMDIQRLVVKSLFLNVAIQTKEYRGMFTCV